MHIAVIDDSEMTVRLIQDILNDEGYNVLTYSSAIDFLADLQKQIGTEKEAYYDLVISDVRMPGLNGIDFVRQMKKSHPSIPIVLMTAAPKYEDAVLAIKEGACDYIPKPGSDLDQLTLTVKKALKFQTINRENELLKNQIKNSWSVNGIIGKSPVMKNIFEMIERIAPSAAPVLITGESGTGKEMIARLVHTKSNRAHKPFVAINCSAIPENLLESELFGHVKGSFTGAIKDKKGLFEEANGGTLFLDEIADMDLQLQAKLLRVLQDQIVRAVGGNTFKQVDVRIVAATNKDLLQLAEENLFREDLYFRLNVIPIALPALRNRRDDILPLIEHFLQKFSSLYGRHIRKVSPSVLEKIYQAPWRGNIRELENAIERAVILCESDEIKNIDVPQYPKNNKQHQSLFFEESEQSHHLPNLKDLEGQYVKWLLNKTNNNMELTAKILGVSIRTLYRKRESAILEKQNSNLITHNSQDLSTDDNFLQ